MFNPIGDYVFIVEDFSENKTESGIIFTTTSNTVNGTVIAVGKGKTLDNGTVIPPSVKENDKIVFDKRHAMPIEVAGIDCLLIKEENILAVVEK